MKDSSIVYGREARGTTWGRGALVLSLLGGAALTAAACAGQGEQGEPVGEAAQASNASCTGGVCTSASANLYVQRPGATAASVVDTGLNQATPGTNNGTSQTMAVGTLGGTLRYALIQFDLSAISSGTALAALHASGVNVGAASVTLAEGPTSAQAPSGAGTINVHQVTSAWTETTATWNNAPTWSPTAVTSFGNGYSPSNTYPHILPSFDLTTLVQGWAQGTFANDGILLEESPDANRTTFITSESGTHSVRPELTVIYTLTCSSGYADCNNNAADGCEANLGTSTSNCGACGQSCPAGDTCQSGACVAATSACSDVAFAPHADYATGQSPALAAVADLNGDGKLDLAVSDESGAVSVLLGNGDGTFAANVDYPTGPACVGIVAADLNGDGKPDLVCTNDAGGTVSVLLNNGNGTFAAHVDYAVGAQPLGIAAVDLNGDGKPDLVVANEAGGTVSVLLNNGNGTFAANVDYAVGSQPFGVVAADLNGDGKPDLAAANINGNTVSVLLGNGDGTFGAQAVYATGTGPALLAAADLNGDGKLDLATANAFGNTVSVLLGNGDGTFAAHVDYATGAEPVQVVAVDLNGDGKLDLATSNEGANTVSVLLNNGNGTFAANVDFATGSFPGGIAAGDLNGDGRADLVSPNLGAANVSVLLNTCTP